MSAATRIVSAALRTWGAPPAWQFHRALRDVAASQRTVLGRILRASAGTAYCRKFRLGPRDGAAAFREKIPIVDYGALEPWIDRELKGETGALVPGGVRLIGRTSGSSGAVKRVPYNAALLRSFRRLFAVWAHDVLTNVLHPRSGRVFMSVSPPMGEADGLRDDRDYLGAGLRFLIEQFQVTPRQRAGDTVPFRTALAAALINCADLEVISIWNPSYLLVMMDHAEERRTDLRGLLAPDRRHLIDRGAIDWRAVWPELQLVSCWTDAAAGAPARRLMQLLGGVTLQGKGLLATEAPVTVPLCAASGCVPLVDEVFLELENTDGQVVMLHDARAGESYAIIVTQAGGFLRYRLGDRVRVNGFHGSAPLLEFLGRVDAVADLVGEKLHEDFVSDVLGRAAHAGSFCTLLPVLETSQTAYYRLLTDDPDPELAARVDRALRDSPRYGEARDLGQLAPVSVTTRADMRGAVHECLIHAGQAAGNIKDRSLVTSLEVAGRFRPLWSGDQREAR